MRSSTDPRPSLSLRHAVAAVLALSAATLCYQNALAADDEVTKLSDVDVMDDPLRAMSSEPSAASFGFAKPLLETPRTVTFVSEEQLRLFSVSSVEDLSRLVPGVYTTTRYGLQGGINIRGVSADFYYRGMKRLNQQGHVRTVLSAYDNIEVIKGPPSPLYGMGKIGGYANLDPKSSRAKTGKYKLKEDGYFQATVGTYDKNEVQFGIGIPLKVADRAAGVYLMGLLEDSGSYVKTVKAEQKFFQATTSVDRAVGPFRLETGGQMQNSKTSGAYFTRVTQDLIDNGRYITGSPMANLDINGDGRIGYVETYIGSPVVGSASSNNSPLLQRYPLLLDSSTGKPRPISSYANSITGIPQSYKNYLKAHSELGCTAAVQMRDVLPAMAVNTGLNPVTREIPVGFALNPCSVNTVKLSDGDYRGNGAFERLQNATQRMAYIDLIYDTDPNFTMKNQIFYDSIISFKDSWLPYGENQAIRAVEEKFTATKKLPSEWLPDWLAVNTLGSVNYRNTSGYIRSSGGDFDFRQDITAMTGANGSGTGGFGPNEMFWTQLTNNDYGTGATATVDRKSSYSETGIGLLFDIDIFRNTNLTAGARYDKVDVTVQERQNFNNVPTQTINYDPLDNVANTDTSNTAALYRQGAWCAVWVTGCPGAFQAQSQPEVSASKGGVSWSASLNQKLPWFGLVPYVTVASSTIPLDGANNLYSSSTFATFKNNGAAGIGTQVASTGTVIGKAGLKEVGLKGSAFRGKVTWSLAGFEQERTDVSAPTDLSVGAEVSSTKTKGIDASINLAPTKKLFVQLAGTYMDARYITGGTATTYVDANARDLGFQDIKDPTTGQVLVPAEALMYGGRVSVGLNDAAFNVYDEVPGTPKWTGSFSTTYQLSKGFSLLGNAQYASESWGTRLQTLKIPAATTLNVGAAWDGKVTHLKFNVNNVLDEVQFRATNGSGNRNMASVLPDRRYEASIKIDF